MYLGAWIGVCDDCACLGALRVMNLDKQEPVTSAVVREGQLVAGGPSRGLLASGYWLQRNLREQHTLGREAWTEWRVRGDSARRGVLEG